MAIDPNERPPLFTPETEELVREMLKNPDVSPKFRRLLKEANPKAVLPLIDLEDNLVDYIFNHIAFLGDYGPPNASVYFFHATSLLCIFSRLGRVINRPS